MALLTLPIREVRIETPRSRVVRLPLGGQPFPFLAGQWLSVGLHDQALRKPYSIACSPEQCQSLNAIELLIQVAGDGYAGAHLDRPAPGMLVDLEGPFGNFYFPEQPSEHDFLFVAGGTGIAPLRAMLWHAIETFAGSRPALFYSARAADEFAYAAELRELAATGRIVLRETVTREVEKSWKGERGRITRSQIAAIATPATLCFVCGPPALVQDVTTWLQEIGIAPAHIRADGWG